MSRSSISILFFEPKKAASMKRGTKMHKTMLEKRITLDVLMRYDHMKNPTERRKKMTTIALHVQNPIATSLLLSS